MNFNNLNSERMTPDEFLYKQGYTQKVRYPDGKEVEPTFQRITVIRLLEEYAKSQANGHKSEQRQLTIPDVSKSVCDCPENCRTQEDDMLFCSKCGARWD
jgi:hypothetical protein